MLAPYLGPKEAVEAIQAAANRCAPSEPAARELAAPGRVRRAHAPGVRLSLCDRARR